MPLVSIIIPACNTARYIHRAIESSLNQTHKNIELLIVDDGSTDETLEVIQSYAQKDSRIRIFTQENSGVSVARNRGISETRGEYIVFVDSDDWLELDAVEVMLKAQIANPGKIVGVNYWFVFDDEERQEFFARTKAMSAPSRELKLTDTIYEQSKKTFPQTACAKIYSAEIIRKHNLRFREGIHHGEDQFFALEYTIRTEGSVYIDRPLYDYYLDRTKTVAFKPNVSDWYLLDFGDVDIAPEVQKALKFYLGKISVNNVGMPIFHKASKDTIKKQREKAKPFMRVLLTSKHLSLPRKIYTICAEYLPIPLARMIISFWQNHKETPSRRKKEDSIPRW